MQIIEIYHLAPFEKLAKECGVKTIFLHHSESGFPGGATRYFFLSQGFLFMFETSEEGDHFTDKGFNVVMAQVFPYYELFELKQKWLKRSGILKED